MDAVRPADDHAHGGEREHSGTPQLAGAGYVANVVGPPKDQRIEIVRVHLIEDPLAAVLAESTEVQPRSVLETHRPEGNRSVAWGGSHDAIRYGS